MAGPFAHLHVHTKYSLLDGACHIKPLVARAKELGMTSLAMTDHGVMYGTVEFIKTCKAAGIRPIIGCELYVTHGQTPHTDRTPKQKTHHLIVLAKNDEGYKNLCRLNSIAQLDGFYFKPRVDKNDLRKYHHGLIALSACLAGEVAKTILEEGEDAAEKVALEYASIFNEGCAPGDDENFFLEMQDHGICEQVSVNIGIRRIMARTGLRAVVTNDVHYLYRDHAEAHEVMLCIQTGNRLSDPDRMRYGSDEFYFKSREELELRFPEETAAFDLTEEIAQRCHASIPEIDHHKIHFPNLPLPPGFATDKEYLVHLGHEGLRRRYGFDPKHPQTEKERALVKQFDYEISVIEKTGFINYFLVVQDFVQYSLSHGIPVGPGRGSGAGSLVAYSLNITRLDPTRFDLIFERFLNPDRISPPDFDIDFCQSRRRLTIEYVREKYGKDRVAQIVTFGQLGAKTVVSDVARVLDIPLADAMRYSKMIPEDPKMTLDKAQKENPEFAAACKSDPQLQRIMRYAPVLEGLVRTTGMHAAGVVIGDQPLFDLVPLSRGKDDSGDPMPVTQYAKEPVEECGLLKMDFLGLKTLTVLQEAVDLVKELHGVSIDLDEIPLDDEETYRLFQRADTVGVFQLESGGMRKILVDLGPTCIEDVIAILALYRPGPMDQIPTFIARKKGTQPIEYPHPLLEATLKSTYGIIVYQEQVQRAANILAGYTLGEADLLRRAMGKKKVEVMVKERKKFVEGCQRLNNIPPERAGEIFDTIEKFAGYGFNKAHAAAYGIVTYQTAYLKAHYPAEFMAAQISSEIGNFEKLPGFVAAADDMGLSILPPDVNASYARFRPEGKGIRFGLGGIKSVGELAGENIVAERLKGGPFKDFVDYCTRVTGPGANKRVLEALAKCGAFDSLDPNRCRIFQNIDWALAEGARLRAEAASGQSSLFGEDDQTLAPAEMPDFPWWEEQQRLGYEREHLGIYLSGHPLQKVRTLVKAFQTHHLSDLTPELDGHDVRLAALLDKVDRRLSKKTKNPWAILFLDDGAAKAEALAFEKCYAQCQDDLADNAPVLIEGRVSVRDGRLGIICNSVCHLLKAPATLAEAILIDIPAGDTERLRQIATLAKQSPGPLPLILKVHHDQETTLVRAADTFSLAADPQSIESYLQTLGADTIHFLPKPLTSRRRWR